MPPMTSLRLCRSCAGDAAAGGSAGRDGPSPSPERSGRSRRGELTPQPLQGVIRNPETAPRGEPSAPSTRRTPRVDETLRPALSRERRHRAPVCAVQEVAHSTCRLELALALLALAGCAVGPNYERPRTAISAVMPDVGSV